MLGISTDKASISDGLCRELMGKLMGSEPKPFGYVYLIRNMIDGRVYVGQTQHPISRRWNTHLTGISPLRSEIEQHGRGSFMVFELARAGNQEELNELESRYIEIHNSRNPESGYNSRSGGSKRTASVVADCFIRQRWELEQNGLRLQSRLGIEWLELAKVKPFVVSNETCACSHDRRGHAGWNGACAFCKCKCWKRQGRGKLES